MLGAVPGTATPAVLTAAIIRLGDAEAGPASQVLVFGIAPALGAAFVVGQRRAPAPMMPPALFTARGFRWVVAVGFLFNFCLYGTLLSVTLVLQAGFGFGPLAAGPAALPLTAVVLVGATASGLVAARRGPRAPMLLGLTAGAVGAVLVAAGGGSGSVSLTIGGLGLLGFCSPAMPAMTSVALTTAPAHVRGLASGALNTARQMGGASGIAALGAVLSSIAVDGAGLAAAMLLTVTGYLAALVCAWLSTAR